MFRDEPRAFIIAMMTHIRNRYVMDNLYSHGSLQDFRAYLYEKIHELLQYGTPEDVEFYIEERQPFFEIDQDGNELLSMENNLLEDLSSGNDHDYFVSMINLYRGLPRGLTTNEILNRLIKYFIQVKNILYVEIITIINESVLLLISFYHSNSYNKLGYFNPNEAQYYIDFIPNSLTNITDEKFLTIS